MAAITGKLKYWYKLVICDSTSVKLGSTPIFSWLRNPMIIGLCFLTAYCLTYHMLLKNSRFPKCPPMNNAHQYISVDCTQIYQWQKPIKPNQKRTRLPIYSRPLYFLGSTIKIMQLHALDHDDNTVRFYSASA